MKIALDRIDSHGFVVDLPGTRQERVAIRSATRLRGLLEHAGDRLALSETAAEIVVLEALRVLLGELALSNESGGTLHTVTMSLAQDTASFVLEAGAASVVTADLSVVIDDVALAFGMKLTGAQLSVRDAEGSLRAEHVELTDFSLRLGELRLASPALSGRAVAIRWGADGFALDAAAIAAEALDASSGGARLAFGGVGVEALAIDGPKITVGRASAERGRVEVALAPRASARATPEAATPFFDWRALDGLSGEIDVDLEVDITVPIIGHRKATHRLRVPIAGGTLDYRALENNLAALENALLDFSVRDGALRLERVNPLFPARGHGKPIVIWDLDASDLALAEQERVRLAVLPSARLADASGEADEPDEPARKSSIALRRLALHRIDVKLALAPVEGALSGQLRPRGIGSIVLQGSVDHAADDTRPPGSIMGELSALDASIVALPVGASTLDVARIALGSASPFEMSFRGVAPTHVQIELADVALDGVVLSPQPA